MIRRQTQPHGIRVRKLPLWMQLRDVLITVLAWLVIAHFMREALHMGYEYVWHFRLINARVPNWRGTWNDLHGFLIVAACLIAWLTFWALYSRKRLRSASMTPQPGALPAKEHAATIGLTEAQLSGCKFYLTTAVFFDAQHKITEIRAQRAIKDVGVA